MQSIWHESFTNYNINQVDLRKPPTPEFIRLVSLDDKITLAKVIMLWLQAFDTQPGISLPLKDLDYDRVIEWLDLILKLDKKTEYPLLAAARFYTEVQDTDMQRKMIGFLKEKFLEAPNDRWPVMAHSVYIAKHRIKDLQLALQCARLIRRFATDEKVPYWARQMEFFVLEEMGEVEAARILIGGLIESGELNDPQQRKFLEQRLKELEDQQTQSAINSN